MRRFCSTLLLSVALPSLGVAQSIPDAGSIRGKTYTNDIMRLTWEFPADWGVAGSSDIGEDFHNHALLRLRPNGPKSNEYLQLGFTDPSAHYEETLASLMAQQGWEPAKGQGYYTLGGGVPAHRYDFQSKNSPTRCLSVAVGPWHGYEISVASVADVPGRCVELIRMALTMEIRPDWPPDGRATIVPLTKPGAVPSRVRVSQGVAQALCLCGQAVQPIYPAEAKKAHVQGDVVMLAHIGKDGEIQDLYIKSGDSRLAQAAIDAVSRWRYQPYQLNGQPVELETQITVRFTLN